MKNCPSCHKQFNDDLAFCQYCGVPLSEAPAPAPTEKTFFCKNCGHPLAAGAKFCPQCGFALESDPTSIVTQTPSSTDAQSPAVKPPFYAGVSFNGQEKSIKVSLQTGKNTVFGASTSGTLTLRAEEVSFDISLSLSLRAQNHRYRYSEIQSAQTTVSRLGLTPLPVLEVVLKDGTVYHYGYTILQKQYITDFCQTINSRLP